MRKEFEMADEQYQEIIEACKPVPYMIIGNVLPSSPQENANMAWRFLGDELGFEYMTVRPVSGKSAKFFTAETSA